MKKMDVIIIEKDRFKALLMPISGNVPAWQEYFDALEWTLRARSKDGTRQNLRMLNSKDGFLACTDGNRLHVYQPDYDDLPLDCVIPDGNYEVTTATKKQIILTSDGSGRDFPDYWKILDYKAHNVISPIDVYYGSEKQYCDIFFTRLVYHINTQSKKMINLDFVKDAMVEGQLNFQTDGRDLGPLFFGNGSRLAVLMPIIG
jgi:hypothetical protein